MLALLPLLALAATSCIAAPLDGRKEPSASSAARGCYRKHKGHRNGTTTTTASQVEASPSAEAVVVSSSIDAGSAVQALTSTSSSTPTSTAVIGNNAAAVVTSSSAPAATSSASASGSSASTGSDEMDTVLSMHNAFRREYGVGDLVWNTTLAEHAQAVSAKCVFAHSGTQGMGENLAAGVGGGWTSANGVQGWEDEASLYNYADPVFGSSTGHFTQMVWKSTTQLGCAVVDCPSGSIFDSKYTGANKFLTCNYYTPGNYAGQFTENVLQKV